MPSEVNTTLSLLQYVPSEDFFGATAIDIVVDDGSGQVADQLAVNVTSSPPQIAVPVTADTPEDVVVQISDFVLTDIDGFITVSLATPAGTILPNPVLSGDAATVAADLALISYVPNEDFFGPTVIDIQVDDGPHSENNFYNFTVLERSPQIIAPAFFSGAPNQELPLPGVSLDDADGFINLNLLVDIGTMQPSIISGTAESVELALAQISYVPPNDFEGIATLMLSVSDGPHFVESEILLDIASAVVPDVPALTAMGQLITVLLFIALQVRSRDRARQRE
jgi:hypothetical protein